MKRPFTRTLLLLLLIVPTLPLAAQRTILCVGDSITEGWDVSTPWPTRLRARVPGDTVINAGISGELIQEGRRRLPGLLQRYNPSHVLILHGANNINMSQSNARAFGDLKDMVQMVWDSGAKPIVGTVTPFTSGRSARQPRADELNDLIRWGRSESAYLVADIAIAYGDGRRYMQSDGIHPNDAGMQVIANSFFQLLQIADTEGFAPKWSERFHTWVYPQDDGRLWSYHYYVITPDIGSGWSHSSKLGAMFAGSGDGFTWTEKLGWVLPESTIDTTYLYSLNLVGWLEPQTSGSFYSFDFGQLDRTSTNLRFDSEILGPLWIGEFNGWVASDRFGWTWADRTTPLTWFYSETDGWLGLIPGTTGPFWSVNEGNWIPSGG